MYINLDGMEIMVRMRCDELRQQSENSSKGQKRSGYPLVRRTLAWVGGLLVTAGMTLEKLAMDREVYHLSTSASR